MFMRKVRGSLSKFQFPAVADTNFSNSPNTCTRQIKESCSQILDKLLKSLALEYSLDSINQERKFPNTRQTKESCSKILDKSKSLALEYSLDSINQESK